MFSQIIAGIIGVFMAVGNAFSFGTPPQLPHGAPPNTDTQEAYKPDDSDATSLSVPILQARKAPDALQNEVTTTNTESSPGKRAYSDDDLAALAGSDLDDGVVPLGDYRYVTDAPKKGYVYLCRERKDNPGSMVNGPWIHGSTWNFLQKVAIQGSVVWKEAMFKSEIAGKTRLLSGNALPINHTTGIFPVSSSDPAHAYDPNPNTIRAQSLQTTLTANPVYSDTPYCMGGEVGIMLTGVPLFNAFDAGLRDAPAHELQDTCEGHPQGSGEYHYHSLSSCIEDTSVTKVIGFAYDGFPITGPEVSEGKYLTTEDLDECHGITSEIVLDGKKKMSYHYVMTKDFPYSVSCFSGKPSTTGASVPGGMQQSSQPSAGSGAPGMPGARGANGMPGMPGTDGQNGTSGTNGADGVSGVNGAPGMPGGGPPPEALSACTTKERGAQCQFVTERGIEVGVCDAPPSVSKLACRPQ